MSNIPPLMGGFTSIARAMSQTWNVQVIPSGFTACTDGTRIFIPFNADYVKPETKRVLHGLLDHELLHVLHERRHRELGLETPLEKKSKLGSKEGHWYNVLLDIAIESECQTVGMRENLQYKNELLSALPQEDENQRRFVLFLSLAREVKTYKMPEDLAWMAELLEEEIAMAPLMYWAKDVLELTRVVISKLGEHDAAEEKAKEEEKAKQAKSKEKGDSEGEEGASDSDGGEDEELEFKKSPGKSSDDGDSSETGEKDGDDEGADSGSSDPSPAVRDDEDSDDGKGEDESESAGASEDEGKEALKDGEPSATDPDSEHFGDHLDPLRKYLERMVEADTHGMYVPNPNSVAGDRWIIWNRGIPENERVRSLGAYKELSELGEGAIGAMKARQLMYLKSQGRLLARLESDEGDLDANLLHQVRTGNREVFVGEKFAPKIDTAVEILLDLSGSMTIGGKDLHLAIASVAVAESLESGSIPFEMVGFHNRSFEGIPEYVPGTVGRSSFDFIQFKGWDEKLFDCRERFQYMYARQDNADGEAVLRVAQRLAQRRERRKVLVILSDGEPACHGIRPDIGASHLTAVIKRVAHSGIEVIGGGILADTSRFYNRTNGAKSFAINRIGELADKFLGCLGLMPR